MESINALPSASMNNNPCIIAMIGIANAGGQTVSTFAQLQAAGSALFNLHVEA
jgi:hypothetical protein